MEVLLRALAIFIEVVILAAIIYALAAGVRFTVFDLGLGAKYNKFLTAVLVIVGALIVVFFIAHLTFLYPAILGGG